MELDKDSLTDWLQLGFAIIGGFYALYLLRQSNGDKRNQFVRDIFNQLYNDKEIREIIYTVDSADASEIKFGGKLEKQADKTIRYLDYIGYLIKEGKLKPEDIEPFEYEINRIIDSNYVKEYIKWLKTIKVKLDNLGYLPKTENQIFIV